MQKIVTFCDTFITISAIAMAVIVMGIISNAYANAKFDGVPVETVRTI